ncbi:hypothetical protein P4S65_10300 [Pseudoalteromonas sp. B131b]|uniref:hypothetical protein n=1 Tax=Pseudoalteromonas sp. B131b TaxID=630493 RepID=UPI00301D9C73
MYFNKVAEVDNFNLAIFGLGYESRSITASERYASKSKLSIVLGYTSNRECLRYKENKAYYEDLSANIHELDNSKVVPLLKNIIVENYLDVEPISVLVDITVMCRSRLANVLYFLLNELKEGSSISICYNLSSFVAPPKGIQPVKKMGPIIDELSGSLGNLSLPTSLVFGLGYEENKALGVHNYYDAEHTFAFIPKNGLSDFETHVRTNNLVLLEGLNQESVFTYDVSKPYSTYVDLKSLLLSLSDFSRVVLIPLGPKILSAIAVILGYELFPELPVWRVSSLHSETPVERASQKEIIFSVTK